MKSITVGFAICGSFCTHDKAIMEMTKLAKSGYNILPILSYNSAKTDTRFGTAMELKEKIKAITDNKIIETIVDAEPIGPKELCDILVIAPCTGNTLAKISNGITDTPVTMATKSHLRIGRPVLIALCTNDALGVSAQNLGKIMNNKHIYLVPMSQDDTLKKPNSLVAHFDKLEKSLEAAINETQIQPIFL